MASVCASHDDHDTDCVLINKLDGTAGIHDEVALLVHRYKASFDIPVSRKLLKSNLRIRSEDLSFYWYRNDAQQWNTHDVGMEVILSCGLARLLPALLHRKTTQHDSLR